MKTIIKSLHRRTGEMVSNRYQIKKFKTGQAMHTFLNKQSDNEWRETDLDLKSGIYFSQMGRDGARYINVKELSI